MPATTRRPTRPAAASSGTTADALLASFLWKTPRPLPSFENPSGRLGGALALPSSMASTTFQKKAHQGHCCCFHMQFSQPGAVQSLPHSRGTPSSLCELCARSV